MIFRSRTVVGVNEVEEVARKGLKWYAWVVGVSDGFEFGFGIFGCLVMG